MILCRCFDKLEYAEDFLNGNIRMMSLKYYRTKEADNNGRKDKYEGAQKLWQGNSTTILIDGKEISDADGLVNIVLRSSEYEQNTKICCLTLLPVNDEIEGLDGLLQFNLSYCVLFSNPDEFVKRFVKIAQPYNCAGNKVIFYDETTHNGELTKFHKPLSFAWQNEYRLTVYSNSNDPFIINIGDLHDIATVYPTKELVEKLKNAEIHIKNDFGTVACACLDKSRLATLAEPSTRHDTTKRKKKIITTCLTGGYDFLDNYRCLEQVAKRCGLACPFRQSRIRSFDLINTFYIWRSYGYYKRM